MEATGEAKLGNLLDAIQPPRLEDAALKDCALPPNSIQEAFLKAATAVRSRIFQDDETGEDCVNDPWPRNGSSGDKLTGIATEADPPRTCVPNKGGELPSVIGDDVVVGGRESMPDKVVGPDVPNEAAKSCVDGLQGLKIGEKKDNICKRTETNTESNENEDEDDQRQVLAEVCIYMMRKCLPFVSSCRYVVW